MPDGRIRFTREDIGGEILPILTSGLYRDTLDALREYVQNAIDAKTPEIEIVIDPDVVSIRDFGSGMTRTEARKAIRLGISDKNPLTSIGFRGIGIYSGFNLADSLEILTKSRSDESGYRISFDFKQIRKQLLLEQERRREGKAPELYLERLLEQTVVVDRADVEMEGGQGTKVILSGLLSEAYGRLNDWQEVSRYLENVIPVPFDPEFRYGEAITQWFQAEEYKVIPLTLQIGERRASIYRPYKNEIFAFHGQHPPERFELRNPKMKFGFAWVCVNDAREVLKDSNVRGLLLKKAGFSIGDRRYLEPYFGRTVYSRRITGEVIITHPQLIPNAARSDFENDVVRQEFLEGLPKFTRTVDVWANDIQENDRAREVLVELKKRLNEINRSLVKVQRDREKLLELNAEVADIKRRLRQQVRRLETIEPDDLGRTRTLLGEVETFTREALLSQRQVHRRMEREIAGVLRRGGLELSADEEARGQGVPQDLLSLVDAYALTDVSEFRRVLQRVDETILRVHLNEEAYSQALKEMRDFLEGTA